MASKIVFLNGKYPLVGSGKANALAIFGESGWKTKVGSWSVEDIDYVGRLVFKPEEFTQFMKDFGVYADSIGNGLLRTIVPFRARF